MSGQAFGVIGLEVMGRNVAQNVERNGFSVAVYNRTWEKTQDFLDGPAKGKNFKAGKTEAEFCALLERPRKILVLVKAGKPVDLVIEALKPHLQPGDIVIDGGNSLYTDTERRVAALEPTGIKFFGMGVSGGEEGALWGPSLMPGGDKEAYKHLEPILTKIAAKAESDGAPCVTYCGSGGAGHFVKMTHNGIEYGDMQLISEAYDLLKNVGGMSNAQLQQIFTDWNAKGSELRSFLIEITSKVINFNDPSGNGKQMVDEILDVVGMKGTGTWTIQAALNLTVPVPTMAAAVDGREMSMLKSQRVEAEKLLAGPKPGKFSGDVKTFVNDVRAALYCSKICSYAQGMAMLSAANQPKKPDGSGGYDYGMHLEELAKIWRAGCIIRADFLDDITKAFQANPKLPNLLLAAKFKDALASRQDSWRRVIVTGVQNGVATPAFSASLAYYDAYRRSRLPGNLIQAQRDFFGGHTYQRIDKQPAGPYHMEWAPNGKETLVVEGKSRTK